MAFAGLWERWTVPDGIALKGSLAEFSPGEVIETCTILTTAANGTVAPIHHRMPVILPPQAFDPWLQGKAVALDPCPPETMAIHPVSTLVNKPSNDDPRVSARKPTMPIGALAQHERPAPSGGRPTALPNLEAEYPVPASATRVRRIERIA